MTNVQLPVLFDEVPSALQGFYDAQAPWSLLGEGLDELLSQLSSDAIEIDLPPSVHLLGDHIAIGAGSRIQPGAVIAGPIFIGRDVQVRSGAYLRGGNWIGDGCIVGANTEVKRAVLFPTARAPHLNYVGDSILGCDVNLGAGTILSNFRHDGAEVVIPLAAGSLATGRRKLGAVLGDGVLTGCNCVLHPGVVVGRRTQIYPGAQLRSGIYPDDSIIKLRQQLEIVEKS
jgi:NDP-sugar pyrophosphorylase family protein